MKHLLLLLALFSFTLAIGQNAHELAYSFMKTGDHDNAILVLTKALQSQPNDEQLGQDIALAYYYKKDFTQAREHAKKLMELDEPNVVSYQITGMVYRAVEEVKEAEKIYRKALKKFPNSGALYNELGELLWGKYDATAISTWEKGIEMDPSYAGNYYNASTYYFDTKDKVLSIIYGEIFVNMEYLTERATEVKKQILSAYKEKLYLNQGTELEKGTTPFAKNVYETLARQSALTAKGLSVEVLTMIRTKFILEWFANHAEKMPFRLFDYQQQLLRLGLFEAYNQWLFGPVDNLPAFDQWTKTHSEAYKKFVDFQRNRVFKMPHGQFYGLKEK